MIQLVKVNPFRMVKHAVRSVWKRKSFVLLPVVTVVILAGCGDQPKNRIVWSPDGERAIVIASDGLRLTDAQGKLSDVIAKSADPAAWMPDGESLVIVSHDDVKDWNELAKLIPEEEQKRIIQATSELQQLVAEGKALDADKLDKQRREKIEKAFQEVRFEDVVVYVHSKDETTYNKLLEAKLAKNESKNGANVDTLRIFTLSNKSKYKSRKLYQTRGAIDSLSVSQNGEAIAFVVSKDAVKEGNQLYVAFSSNAESKLVSNAVASNADWSADNKSLVYITKREGPLGSLESADVYSEVEQTKEMVKKQLSSVVFDERARVQCTSDGRVFFSTAELTVPAAPYAEAPAQRLFMVEPKRLASVVSLLPQRYKTDIGTEYFHVSPDGRQVAILDKSGIVTVLDTATNDYKTVQAEIFIQKQFEKTVFMPCWRSSDQISFCAPVAEKKADSKRVAEVVLCTVHDKKSSVLSKNWPDQVVEFLDKYEEPKDEKTASLQSKEEKVPEEPK